MIRGIYSSSAGMIVQMKRQDHITNNLANADTVGFKQDIPIIKETEGFDLYRIEKDATEIGDIEKIGYVGLGSSLYGTFTDYTQGRLMNTGNVLDFGIEGEEFFAVDTQHGVKLTRSGNFTLDNDGYVVSMEGDKIVGIAESGILGYIKVEDNKEGFRVGSGRKILGGYIEEQENLKIPNLRPSELELENQILAIKVGDTKNLLKEGNNRYSTKYVKTMDVANTAIVRQGYLEKSTVNIIREMVNMVECSRAYEANQKVLTHQEKTLSQAIQVGQWG